RLDTAAIPVTIFNWLGADAGVAASGLTRYFGQQRINGGAFSTITLPAPLATATSRQLSAGSSYQFQVSAVDAAGNTSSPAAGTSFSVTAFDESNAAISY